MVKKAYNLFNQGKYFEALECYNQITQIDPSLAEGLGW